PAITGANAEYISRDVHARVRTILLPCASTLYAAMDKALAVTSQRVSVIASSQVERADSPPATIRVSTSGVSRDAESNRRSLPLPSLAAINSCSLNGKTTSEVAVPVNDCLTVRFRGLSAETDSTPAT